MARITIEDCLMHVENRFQLVRLAAKRARVLALGSAEPKVPWANDKVTVIALREIAEGAITQDYLRLKPPIVAPSIEPPRNEEATEQTIPPISTTDDEISL